MLELRPAAHYPTTCRVPASESADRSRLSSTVRIAEPPGIEGFAIRISARGRSQRIYLSSRMNLLFRNRPTLAHPPDPPLQVHEAMNNPAAVVLAPFIAGMATLAQPDKKKREKIWSPIARSVLRDRSHEHRKHRDRAFQSLDFAEIADEAFGRPKDQDEFDDSAANCDGNMMLEYLDTIEKKRAFLQITDSQGYIEFNEIAAVKPELESGPAGVDDDPDKATARKLRTLIVSFHTGTTIKLEVGSFSNLRRRVLKDLTFRGICSVRRKRSVMNGSRGCGRFRPTGPGDAASMRSSTWNSAAQTRWSIVSLLGRSIAVAYSRTSSTPPRRRRGAVTRFCRARTSHIFTIGACSMAAAQS